MTPDTSILRLIKLTYSSDELEMYLDAWDVYPTFQTDCQITRTKKQYLREEYVKLLRKQKVNS